MNCPDLTPEDLERLNKIAEAPCRPVGGIRWDEQIEAIYVGLEYGRAVFVSDDNTRYLIELEYLPETARGLKYGDRVTFKIKP